MADPARFFDSVDNLPTLPVVVTQVQKLMGDPSSNVGQIADVISHDQAIASRVIRLVNSAFYGFDDHISSIQHAIVILGLNAVKNLVLGVSVIKTFEDSTAQWSFDRRQFWLHTLSCAMGAKLIAASLKRPDQEDYFLSGLLHDLGLLVIDQFMHREFEKVLKYAKRQGKDYLSSEKLMLGMTHGDVGAYLAAKWKIPDFVVHSIAWHHEPYQAPADTAFSKDKILIVHAADSWAFRSETGRFIEGFEAPPVEQVFADLHIKDSTLESIFQRVSHEVQTLAHEWGV